MHASSLENMYLCYERFIAPSPQFNVDKVVVVDVGGANVNGGYKDVFSASRFHFLSVDLNAGDGVDIVLDDPYRLPFDDASVDVVLSGQMLEHCEFFWLSFAEMIRVLKPGGFLFLIAPSAGPIHRYPVDCYRFYPDAYRALAKYTNCQLHDVWLDERGPWRDLVGVFSRHAVPERAAISPAPTDAECFDPVNSPPGTDAEEAIAGERPYLDVLREIHHGLQPELYIEIGVRHGRSLQLASQAAIGVDPAPEIKVSLLASTQVFTATSDAFFRDTAANVMPSAPDLAFIDGMHLFEYALRDFMNVERLASPNTIVVIDDIYPSHPIQAARTRQTRVWTGDVWKLQVCLAEYRPDLVLLALNTAPTGLLVVAGLNPSSRVLWDQYNPIVRRFKSMDEVPSDVLARHGAISPTGPAVKVALDELAATRALPSRLHTLFPPMS